MLALTTELFVVQEDLCIFLPPFQDLRDSIILAQLKILSSAMKARVCGKHVVEAEKCGLVAKL